MKRTATPAQKALAAERRTAMMQLSRTIAKMPDHDRMLLSERVGIVMTCEHKILSMHNQCMIALQNQSVTIVGGFQQWRRMGRQVRKGEHGVSIWVPLGNRETEDTGSHTNMADEKRFMLATVFDVSQTDEMTKSGASAA